MTMPSTAPSTAKFSKGQSVTDSVAAEYRYRVETVHRDGTYTVRALFALDEQGNDRAGFLGFRYRISANALAPLPAKVAA